MAGEKGKKTKAKQAIEAPQPIETVTPVPERFDASPLLARIDKLENGQKLLNDAVEFVKSTNWFILAVLFLGFIALLASFISSIIQVTNSNTATQIEFIKTVEQFRHDINDLKSSKQSVSTSSGNTTPNK